MNRQTKLPLTKARRLLLASVVAGTTIASTGCTSSGFSMASLNPFSKAETPSATSSAPGMSESIASAAGSAREGVTTMGASARDAVGKTTQAIAGVFRRPAEETGQEVPASDPTSLASKPDKVSADVYVANGQLWESSGDMNKAMESYTKALESEPNSPQALSSIARLNYRQGQYQKANEYFRRALEHNKNDAELYNDIGLTLSKLNDAPGAVNSFQQALSLAPKTSRYANNLATVHFESGDPQSAHQVLVINNKPAVAHFNMAYLYFKAGKMDDAKKHLTAAMQFEPQASQDAIVKRAVDRSREMLAQIDVSTAPIAQAAPQATIAGGQFFNGPQTAPVQQTAQAVAPATTEPVTTSTATQAITPPAVSTPAVSTPTVTANPVVTAPASKPAAAIAATPSWTKSPAAVAKPATKPTRPTPPAATAPAPSPNPEPSAETAPAPEAEAPTPFALPSGFKP